MLRSRSARFLTAFLGVLTIATPVRAGHGDHVVIAEVQVGGTGARDEFVELYNSAGAAISLEGWRLSKRTASGAREENLVASFPAMTIAPHVSVLVAHPEGAFAGSADQRYTTQSSLAGENTVVLYGPAGTDGQRPVVDLVGFGGATSREGASAANPESGQSLERKPGGMGGNGQDTNDNAADFIVQMIPTPQGVSATARPAVVDPSASAPAASAPASDVPTTTSSTTTVAPSPAETVQPSTPTPTTETTPNATASTSASLAEPSPIRTPLPAPTHVRINEFVADPAAGEEWIELVNIGPVPVNLVDWVIEDGAETRTLLSGAIGINDQRFAVVAKPKGQLNNSGDRIVLRNPGGNTVDAVTYGDWNDGKMDDNAPAVTDPASVARVVDGADTDNDRLDFVRTEMPTRGTPNIVNALPTPTADADAPRGADARAPSVLVVLNELYPNPPGDDRAEEYIELANFGTQAADLNDWRIRDELGAEYALASADGAAVIAAGGFLILPRARTGIALNDTGGEAIRLYKPGQERATSVAEYSGEAPEGVAWARAGDGRWQWTTERTPNAANVLTAPNRPPDAVFTMPKELETGAIVAFNGSDSADPDREALAYLWDFGDGETEADVASDAIGRYVYAEPGTYTVTLTVTDARGAVTTAKRRITVRAPAVAVGVEEPPAATPTTTRARGMFPAPATRTARRRATASRAADAPAVARAIGELAATELGARVIIRGSVIASPDTVGKQVFYVADDDAGVEVFFGKRAIPALMVGDAVEARGELREVRGGLRIGVAAASDVRVLGRGTDITPAALAARDASAEVLGALVAVEGEVVEVRGRTVTVDDGGDELRIVLPAGDASRATVRRGDTVRAVGILHHTSAGYRLLARSASDVAALARAPAVVERTAAPAALAPLRDDLELALLGTGGSAVLASSLWRRRRILAFALAATRRLVTLGRRAV